MQQFGKTPGDLVQARLDILLTPIDDFFNLILVFLYALLQFCDGKALNTPAFVCDGLNTPGPMLLYKSIAGPKPVATSILVDGGSHGHLFERTAQWCFDQFEGPAQFYFFSRER